VERKYAGDDSAVEVDEDGDLSKGSADISAEVHHPLKVHQRQEAIPGTTGAG